MAYKDIVVLMGGTAHEERARLAMNLAQAHGAHVVGLHVTSPPEVPAYVDAQLTAEVLEAQARFAHEDRDEAEAVFMAATRASSVGISSEWRAVEGDVLSMVQLHGRHADLVLIGQTDPDSVGRDNPDVAGRAVLSLGRPVLVTPYVGRFDSLGQRVLVAWDATAAATRALGDAMEFLQGAEVVNLISVNPGAAHTAMAGVDIATHLARHDVKVEVQRLNTNDVSVGAMLLSRAADFGADLMVMGAYGHARWRELVLGGVTQHVLEHMTVPVLMSH